MKIALISKGFDKRSFIYQHASESDERFKQRMRNCYPSPEWTVEIAHVADIEEL